MPRCVYSRMFSVSTSVPQIDRERLIEIVTSLVSIPSVSGNEQAIMEFVAGFFEGSRHPLRRDGERPGAAQRRRVRWAMATGPVLAMNGHLDVVPVSESTAGRPTRSLASSPRTARRSTVAAPRT